MYRTKNNDYTFRPEGWKNRYSEEMKGLALTGDWHADLFEKHLMPKEEAFEEGAEAMLGSIGELARQSPTGEFSFDSNGYTIYVSKEK